MNLEELLKKRDKDKTMLDIVKLLELSAEPGTFLHDLQELIAKEAAKVFNTEVFSFHLVIYYMQLARTDALESKK